jgi:hypothetical protein
MRRRANSETGESELRVYSVCHRLRSNFQIAFLIFLLSLVLVSSCNHIAYGESAGTFLSMNPSIYLATEIGELFDIGVDVSNAENLRNSSFMVTFNGSFLGVEQVMQGQFFPLPPRAQFEYETNQTLGYVKISMSLADLEPPKSGNGTLAYIRFRVTSDPTLPANSPLELRQTLLLDSASKPIIHDSDGAVYFWKLIQPDAPVEGRSIDLYTQKGGQGSDEPDGEFMCGELVHLVSLVAYNGYPVQQKLVTFVVRNPFGEVVLISTAVTDQNGIAETSFRIPNLPSSAGEWTAVAIVEVAEKVVWDTLSFWVRCVSVVGGYSLQMGRDTTVTPLALYLTLLTILGGALPIIKRKQ